MPKKWQKQTEEVVQNWLEGRGDQYPDGINRKFTGTTQNGNAIEGFLTDGDPPKVKSSWLKPDNETAIALRAIPVPD